MASEHQLMANRQNALKSTGPKTVEGKAHACLNSLKHGLLTKDLLIREEKPKDLQSFRDKIYCSLCPQGAMEELFVEKIVNAAWRLRRLAKAESEFLDNGDSYSRISLEQAFRGNNGNALHVLSRYEASLERTFYKAVHELQRVQAMRMGQVVVAPIAVEVCESSDGEIGFVS